MRYLAWKQSLLQPFPTTHFLESNESIQIYFIKYEQKCDCPYMDVLYNLKDETTSKPCAGH